MALNKLHLTGPLARAARALVKTSAAHTAEAAGLSAKQLRSFEKGRVALSEEEKASLRAALEQLGAMFIAEGPNGRGQGVRLKFSKSGAKRVATWESEGGLAADDDV